MRDGDYLVMMEYIKCRAPLGREGAATDASGRWGDAIGRSGREGRGG